MQVTGTIAAVSNGFGVVGVVPHGANIYGVNIFGENAGSLLSSELLALVHCEGHLDSLKLKVGSMQGPACHATAPID